MTEFVNCNLCEGKGVVGVGFNEKYADYHFCPKCDGIGKVTWIEQVFGKSQYENRLMKKREQYHQHSLDEFLQFNIYERFQYYTRITRFEFETLNGAMFSNFNSLEFQAKHSGHKYIQQLKTGESLLK